MKGNFNVTENNGNCFPNFPLVIEMSFYVSLGLSVKKWKRLKCLKKGSVDWIRRELGCSKG